MTIQDINAFFKTHFHLSLIVGAVIAIALLVLMRSCANPIPPSKEIDSTTHSVVVDNNTVTTHTTLDSSGIIIKDMDHNVELPIPVVHSDYRGQRTNLRDTCSPIAIDKIILRSDGGYIEIVGTVDCRNDSIYISRIFVSPVDTQFRYVDTSKYLIRIDSTRMTVLSRMVDSLLMVTHTTDSIKHVQPFLTLNASAAYDPWLSRTFNFDVNANIPLTSKWSLYPHVMFVPMNPSLFQTNIGIQYKILEIK